MSTVVAVADGAVWAAAAVAVLACLRSAVRRPPERPRWLGAAAAAALLALSSPAGASPWASAAAAAAVLLVCHVQLSLEHERMQASVVGSWLDLTGAAVLYLAVTTALGSGRVRQALGLGDAAAALHLAPLTLAVMAAPFAVVALLVARGSRDRRMITVALAAALLLGSEAARAAPVLVAADAGAGLALAERALRAGALLALGAAAATAPPAAVVRHREGSAAVVMAPASTLLMCCALLVWGPLQTLPWTSVALVVATILISTAKMILVFGQVTALHLARTQSLTDDLTGLGNRRALVSRLAAATAGAPLALALVDLDRFKAVNDALGHDAGDDLLRQVARRLQEGCLPGDLLTRQGGDEFALVLRGAGAAQGAGRAADLVRALDRPFTVGDDRVVVSVGASVGVAAAPEHARDATALLRAADRAMYRAKAAGGGVAVHDAALESAQHDEDLLLADLQAAVADHGLTAHYQPQLDRSGALVGLEALVRWEHPTRGLLAPAAFLPLVERHGLMVALTEQVLGAALATAARLGTAGHGVRMSVNVSAASLHDPDLVTTVVRRLLAHDVPPHGLVLEITETELMVDPPASRRVIAALVDLGIGVSIDDYGTGHSSLAYLRDLPATELKLDRSFVAALTTDPRTADIVRTTVDLAHSLGLRLVAEGVEDAPTLAALTHLGADTTQGYHHARPMPAEHLPGWIARHAPSVVPA